MPSPPRARRVVLGLAGLAGVVASCSARLAPDSVSQPEDHAGDAAPEPSAFGDAWRPIEMGGEPAACRAPEACLVEGDAGGLALLFPAPPGVELRAVSGGLVVGFDRGAARFVAFRVAHDHARAGGLAVRAFPLDPRYDRVLPDDRAVLACAGVDCELLVEDLGSPLARTVKVPLEVNATSVHGDCVAGRGIVCFHPSTSTNSEWTWSVPVHAVPEVIVSFARLRDDIFVTVDSAGAARSVYGSMIAPLPIASADRLVSLAGQRGARPLDWLGLTANRQLVSGTTDRAIDCGGPVRAAAMGPNGAFAVVTDDALLRGTHRGFHCTAEPTRGLVVLGVGHAPCGLSANPFVLTAAGLHGPPTTCWFD